MRLAGVRLNSRRQHDAAGILASMRLASGTTRHQLALHEPGRAPLCLAGCCCLAGTAGSSSAAMPGRLRAIMRCICSV